MFFHTTVFNIAVSISLRCGKLCLARFYVLGYNYFGRKSYCALRSANSKENVMHCLPAHTLMIYLFIFSRNFDKQQL